MTTQDDPGRKPQSNADILREQGCGRHLGRYTLLRRLAQGGMAEVYLARAADISGFARPVAIKKILPQFSNNERFIDMLKDEAKITVSLTHPNIAQVYELGLAGEDYFIVMEYVQGRPLNKLMQRVDEEGIMSIPVPHAVHIMAEIAKGLGHAHGQTDARGHNRNIVHRDVSPQNVLIGYAGDVKLIDFGIARAEGRANQTNQGVIKGKLRYLAPEIAVGLEPDHRADLFCCGIVLFEMLTGEAMFAPKSDLEAIELASQGKVKSPRARNPRVPEALDDIVMRALRKERDERVPSAQALHLELTRFLRQHDPTYAEGALAGFMRTMFRPEIKRERALNAAAAALVEAEPVEPVDDPTLAAIAADYQQIVTRVEIPTDATVMGEPEVENADGGSPMVVVPAAAPPPAEGPAESPFTPPARQPVPEPAPVQFSTTATLPRDPATRLGARLASVAGARSLSTTPPPKRPCRRRLLMAAAAMALLGAGIGWQGRFGGPTAPADSPPDAGSAPVDAAQPTPALGTLKVTAWPSSLVYVNGTPRGRSPLTLSLPAGKYAIDVESPTGKLFGTERAVRAGRTTTFVYRWQ